MRNVFVLALSALVLASCGVKPGSVESGETHPRTYPNVQTDPLPNGGPGATVVR